MSRHSKYRTPVRNRDPRCVQFGGRTYGGLVPLPEKLGMTDIADHRNISAVEESISIWQEAPKSIMRSSAEFSACRTYRYSLTRSWQTDRSSVLFIGLNPSTADETVDDPTVRRCVGFARRWGFGEVTLANLFAFRSTDPAVLAELSDPIGPGNDDWITKLCQVADLIIVAWGARGSLHERDRAVLTRIPEAYCLGTTKNGAPRHPLYLAADTHPEPYSG